MVGPYVARLRAVRVDPPLVALVVLGFVAVAGFGYGDAGPFPRLVAFWLLMGAVHLFTMLTAWRLGVSAATSVHEPQATARIWRLVALTGATLLAGDLIQLVTSVRDPRSPEAITGTGPQLALLGVGMLGLLYGFLRFPLGTPGTGALARLRLDAATVMVGAATFGLWAFQVPPGERGWGWAVELTFAMLLQPGLFLVAVFLVVKVVLSDRSPFTRAGGPLIVLAAVVTGILQSVPPAAYLSERHGPLIMAGNLVGSILLGVGLRAQELQVRTETSVRAARRPYSALPYGALIATWALAVMLLAASGLGWRTWAVSAGALVSTLLVVARRGGRRQIAGVAAARDVARAATIEGVNGCHGLLRRGCASVAVCAALSLRMGRCQGSRRRPPRRRSIEVRSGAAADQGRGPSRLGGDDFDVAELEQGCAAAVRAAVQGAPSDRRPVPQQERHPAAVRPPARADRPQRGQRRLRPQVVELGHGPVQPRRLAPEKVHQAGAADQDQLRRERPDARAASSGGPPPPRRTMLAEQVGVQLAGGGRLAQAAQVLHLADRHPGHRVEAASRSGAGKACSDPVSEVHRRPAPPRSAPHRPGLDHRDPVAEQGPGRRLVRSAEQHRPQPREPPLKIADDRIADADLGEPAPSASSDRMPLDVRPGSRSPARPGLATHVLR